MTFTHIALSILILSGCTTGALMNLNGPLLTIRYEGQKEDTKFQAMVESSIRKILQFSEQHRLGISKSNAFVTEAVVYSSKNDFDQMIIKSPDWPENTSVPKTYVGFGQKQKFYVVSWAGYQTVFPEGSLEDYEKLITHELTHLFHIAYLKGREDEMGPVWFYEGFACLVADQFTEDPIPATDKIKEIVYSPERGSYRIYAPMVRALAKQEPIADLLKGASDKDFSKHVEKILSK